MKEKTTHSNTEKKESKYVLGTYARMPFVLTHGEGMTVFDSNGKAYLDFGAGIAVNALGHAHPAVVDAIRQQAGQLGHVSNLYHTPPHAELAEALCESSFADKVFFSNSGAEAVEAALKFSRKYCRRHFEDCSEIITFQGGFHGRTYGALSVTPREKYQAPFKPLVPGVTVLPYNDPAAFTSAISPKTCAVIVEPVQGEGGIQVASEKFIKTLRKQCDNFGALLIFDEIQAGLGRTGRLWAHEHYGVEPDIMTSAKALGGGLPIGATLVKKHVADAIEAGDHGSTFGGGPIVCSAALAVLNTVNEPGMLKHIREMGQYLVQSLEAMKAPGVLQVRGMGLMVGIEFADKVDPIVTEAAQKGVLVLSAGQNVLRLLPPYIVQKQDIDRLIAVLKEILT